MKLLLAFACMALLLGCAEMPPPDAAIQTEAAAINIGKDACKPYRLKAETDTHFAARMTEYADRLHDHWEAIYANGVWEVGGGHRYGSERDKKCHDLQVQVDARTGKPKECGECVVVG